MGSGGRAEPWSLGSKLTQVEGWLETSRSLGVFCWGAKAGIRYRGELTMGPHLGVTEWGHGEWGADPLAEGRKSGPRAQAKLRAYSPSPTFGGGKGIERCA